MDREELTKMKLEALRVLAQERGVDGARRLGKAELIDKLAPRTIVERAQEAVAHAVEVVEHKAHELADKVKGAVSHQPSAVSSRSDAAADATKQATIESKAAHP